MGTLALIIVCGLVNIHEVDAAILITSPSIYFVSTAEQEYFEAISLAIKTKAAQWELIDRRECNYMFRISCDFADDLATVKRRYAELKDAPPLSDALLFPPRETISAGLVFNREYRKHLINRLELESDRVERLQLAIKETDELYAMWDWARDAQCEFYYINIRRRALNNLRMNMPIEAYKVGWLPPCVPLHRFEWLR